MITAEAGRLPKIGYLAQKYPQLTLTFVYREVSALRASGVDIATFSIWRPRLEDLSAEARGLMAETVYVFPLDWPAFLANHLRYAFTRPARYFGTLLYCLTRPHVSWANRRRTLLHFAQAVHLARAVEERGLRHLHVHFALNAATVALVIKRLTGITYSFTAHANDLFVNPILLPEKIADARFIVAISEYNRRHLCAARPGPETEAKVHIVRYGIDVGRFAPPPARPVRAAPTILSVARLVEKKGFPDLIRACARLAGQGRAFSCLIIGGGPQEALLRRMIQSAGLDDHVRLVGRVFQEDLRRYFDEADIFALPCVIAADGDRDGIPNTLIEAMAMELPVVSTAVSGIPELIEDGRSGRVVPPGDPAALAGALAELLDDPQRRAALGRAGRARVLAEFEIEKNAQALQRLFAAYLAPDGAQRG